jgi:RNA polymerase sigma factor (TIGR02999 family)
MERSRSFLWHCRTVDAAPCCRACARHNAAKRGGLGQRLTLDEARDLPTNNTVELVALDQALDNFAQSYPRKSEVVELKFFGGLEAKEISEVLQVSEKTVLRDWNFAKLWLCRALSQNAA